MIYKILISLILFFSLSVLAQCPNGAKYYNLDIATTAQQKLYYLNQLLKNNFENKEIKISELYYSIGKNKLGYKYLERAIIKGSILEFDFINSIPVKHQEKIRKEKLKLFCTFLKTHNEQLYEKIKYLINVDQYFAKEDFYGGRKGQHEIREKIFQNNLTQLKNNLIEHNNSLLPNYRQIGHLTKSVALLLIHHTRNDSLDEENFVFFERILKEEICSGKTYQPTTYVQLVDNMKLVREKGFLQIYGHYQDFKTRKILPLKFPDKVDSLRKEIGLQPLKEYAKKNGYLLPENYIEQ